jgi:hypothetical protein
MARNEFYSVTRTPVSVWHRKQHDLVALTDCDFLSICPACAKNLIIADTIYNKDNSFKGKSEWLQRPYKQIAQCLKIPYWIIWYTVDETKTERPITKFHLKRIYPNPSTTILELEPDQFLQYLEHKVQQHIPDCNSKEYLKKRMNADTEFNKNLTRKDNYERLLS